jgi:hypothetical protein
MTGISIHIVDTNDHRQVKQFLELPFNLYQDTPQWVPPLAADAKKILNRQKNPFFLHSEAIFFLAFRDGGNPVGRLAILDNHNYNQFNNEKTAFFYLFECENMIETAQMLFNSGLDWAAKRGLNKIIGPRGFSVFDGTGLLVEGFNHRPAFGLPYNLPYYPRLVESIGFSSAGDSLSGYLDDNVQFPDKIHEVAGLLLKRRGLHIAKINHRRDLRSIVSGLKDLYNASLANSTGTVPITDDEANTIASQLLWFADPRLIKIVMKDDQPIGFLFAYPDVSAALQQTKGKLFPFGWAYLLLELRKTKWININGMGLKEGYRGVGGSALLLSEMVKSLEGSRYRYADIVQIGSENGNMLRELRDLGIDFYKTHRMYELVFG